MEISDAILTSIIAGIVSVSTVAITLIFKPAADKWLYLYKVKTDHKYDQIRRVKETLAKRKVPLINAAESLAKRFNSISRRRSEQLHDIGGDYTNIE